MANKNPLETAREAYSGKVKTAPDMPQLRQFPKGMRPVELARLGYKQSQRDIETKKRPAKSSLDRVVGRLPSEYLDLLLSPPTRQEMRFLPRDMQTLMTDLEQANKAIQAIPWMEQEIKNIDQDIDAAIADREPDEFNNLKLSLEQKKASLDKIRGFVDFTFRAATAYHENNPQDIAKSKEMLKTLRTELAAPYSYPEAKDALPKLTKPVSQWLDDLKEKASLDDRILAKKVLEAGGIDAKAILTEVDRQGLSLSDKAVEEMRDRGEVIKVSVVDPVATKVDPVVANPASPVIAKEAKQPIEAQEQKNN